MINDNDREGLACALAESIKSTFGRVKIGAYVASHTHCGLGCGHNQRKTHPRQYAANKRTGRQIERPCLHAEIAAIMDAQEHGCLPLGKPYTMYVARLNRNGMWANCMPCAACHSEIVRAGIKRVVYTTEGGVREYVVHDATARRSKRWQ